MTIRLELARTLWPAGWRARITCGARGARSLNLAETSGDGMKTSGVNKRGAILKYQPVDPGESEDWTRSFDRVIGWLDSGRTKRIRG